MAARRRAASTSNPTGPRHGTCGSGRLRGARGSARHCPADSFPPERCGRPWFSTRDRWPNPVAVRFLVGRDNLWIATAEPASTRPLACCTVPPVHRRVARLPGHSLNTTAITGPVWPPGPANRRESSLRVKNAPRVDAQGPAPFCCRALVNLDRSALMRKSSLRTSNALALLTACAAIVSGCGGGSTTTAKPKFPVIGESTY